MILLLSVGESVDPCAASVVHHAGLAEKLKIVFFASQRSKDNIPGIKARVGGFDEATILLGTDDEYDLGRCYSRAREAVRTALDLAAGTARVTVDITGGTKTMVAALALAAADHRLEFAYVVSERQSDGRFRQDTERVQPFPNPLHALHVRELERLQGAWNAGRITEARDSLKLVLDRDLPEHERVLFEHARKLLDGFARWDAFDHAAALERIDASTLRETRLVAQAARLPGWTAWLDALAPNLDRLARLARDKGGPTSLLLGDLLANAERRATAGRHDDALARLYRAVEMHAEVQFGSSPDRTTGLKKTLEHHHQREAATGAYGKATALYQDYANGPLGTLLGRRHDSILAHGTRPATRADYDELATYLRHTYGMTAAPAWPRLESLA